MSLTQLWLFNPDIHWPGYPSKPDGEGWIWFRNEIELSSAFGQYASVEIFAAAHVSLRDVHETLTDYGFHKSGAFLGNGIGGRVSRGTLHFLAIGARGGCWARAVSLPNWSMEEDAL